MSDDDGADLALFPAELQGLAHVAINGELFWPETAAPAAARCLAAHDRAVVGGEVYARHAGAWATFLTAWVTEPEREPGEPWPAFVERALSAALVAMDDPPDAAEARLFFFAQATENTVERRTLG